MAALSSKYQLEDTVVGCFDRGAFSEAIEIVSDEDFTQTLHAESREDAVLRRRQLKAVAELLKFGQEGGDERYFMERYGTFAKLVHPDKCRMEAKQYCEKAFRILQQCRKHSSHLGSAAAVVVDESDIHDDDDNVWWDSWDDKDNPYDGDNSTHDDEDDVEELAALSVDDLKEEVRKREDSLWGDSTTLSLEERRQRLMRAREVLADRLRKAAAASEEVDRTGGGFLPE
ncbi:hypothetical protein M9434_000181 [Picochlorum sp. BPE23]|nr:hypothetical protein M9434_000181 [Picochlorum sp. BPE23]